MQPEQPLIAPALTGRGGDTALGMEQRSPEQRPPPAVSPRAAVQVVMLQPLLAAASVPLYAGPIQWMGQLAGPISGFVDAHVAKEVVKCQSFFIHPVTVKSLGKGVDGG